MLHEALFLLVTETHVENWETKKSMAVIQNLSVFFRHETCRSIDNS